MYVPAPYLAVGLLSITSWTVLFSSASASNEVPLTTQPYTGEWAGTHQGDDSNMTIRVWYDDFGREALGCVLAGSAGARLRFDEQYAVGRGAGPAIVSFQLSGGIAERTQLDFSRADATGPCGIFLQTYNAGTGADDGCLNLQEKATCLRLWHW